MRTKRASHSSDPMVRFHAALQRPHTWHIAGIDAFWIENGSGEVLTDEFRDIGPAYEAAVRLMAGANDIEEIVLAGRRTGGGRTELTRGLVLLDLAEAHLGLPARMRTPSE